MLSFHEFKLYELKKAILVEYLEELGRDPTMYDLDAMINEGIMDFMQKLSRPFLPLVLAALSAVSAGDAMGADMPGAAQGADQQRAGVHQSASLEDIMNASHGKRITIAKRDYNGGFRAGGATVEVTAQNGKIYVVYMIPARSQNDLKIAEAHASRIMRAIVGGQRGGVSTTAKKVGRVIGGTAIWSPGQEKMAKQHAQNMKNMNVLPPGYGAR